MGKSKRKSSQTREGVEAQLSTCKYTVQCIHYYNIEDAYLTLYCKWDKYQYTGKPCSFIFSKHFTVDSNLQRLLQATCF